MKRSLWGLLLVCVAMGSGCQTWVREAGLTLPTGRYLRHTPQYIPDSPPYPLTKEYNNLIDAAGRAAPGAGPAAVPGGF